MADTIFFDLSTDDWTDISKGKESGFITNASGNYINYIESASVPEKLKISGHKLNPGDFVEFNVDAPYKVFAIAFSTPSSVAVTFSEY